MRMTSGPCSIPSSKILIKRSANVIIINWLLFGLLFFLNLNIFTLLAGLLQFTIMPYYSRLSQYSHGFKKNVSPWYLEKVFLQTELSLKILDVRHCVTLKEMQPNINNDWKSLLLKLFLFVSKIMGTPAAARVLESKYKKLRAST